jgi:hypothetical protein
LRAQGKGFIPPPVQKVIVLNYHTNAVTDQPVYTLCIGRIYRCVGARSSVKLCCTIDACVCPTREAPGMRF